MRRILTGVIDSVLKRRLRMSYPLYVAAKRMVAAYENRDVAMSSNGEHWLQRTLGARGRVVAVDVGANRGQWALGLLDAVPDCAVYCYEPIPTTFAALREAVDDDRAMLIERAVSSSAGDLRFNSVIDSSDFSSLYNLRGYINRSDTLEVIVEGVTGDAEMERLGLDHVDIVKIDAEGHDVDAIEGFSAALAAGRIGLVQFEYNFFTLAARRSLSDFFDIFGGRYLLCRLLPNGLEATGYHPTMDNFGQSNWVAVRDDLVNAEFARAFNLRAARGLGGDALARELPPDARTRRALDL